MSLVIIQNTLIIIFFLNSLFSKLSQEEVNAFPKQIPDHVIYEYFQESKVCLFFFIFFQRFNSLQNFNISFNAPTAKPIEMVKLKLKRGRLENENANQLVDFFPSPSVLKVIVDFCMYLPEIDDVCTPAGTFEYSSQLFSAITEFACRLGRDNVKKICINWKGIDTEASTGIISTFIADLLDIFPNVTKFHTNILDSSDIIPQCLSHGTNLKFLKVDYVHITSSKPFLPILKEILEETTIDSLSICDIYETTWDGYPTKVVEDPTTHEPGSFKLSNFRFNNSGTEIYKLFKNLFSPETVIVSDIRKLKLSPHFLVGHSQMYSDLLQDLYAGNPHVHLE
jgi:hypothetical protein